MYASISSAILRIAREQWRTLWRDQTAMLALALLLLITAAAAFTAWDQRHSADSERQQRQVAFERAFAGQPDRHPHRMAHYGSFVFRPLSPLAAFDSGVDPYTGSTLFLEAHRQNSANFGDVRQSSLLLRFGQLTPAFVLQFLAPLLLIFVGHAVIARERETGTLRQLLAQGVSAGTVVAGKLLALSGLAGLIALPAWAALACMVMFASASVRLALLLAAGYTLWLVLWALAVVTVSTFAARGRDALVALLALWILGVVVLPRLGADVTATSMHIPTRFESEIAVIRDLVKSGDRMNSNDPHFNAFRERILAQYGVDRVEELPVNYRGLLAEEGERITSELYEKYAQIIYERQTAQLQHFDRLAALSPVMALRRLSMAAAQTDWHEHRRFLQQAEQHRYQMQQALGKLEQEQISYQRYLAGGDIRVSHQHWQGLAEFHYQMQTGTEIMRRIWPAVSILVIWLAVLMVVLVAESCRLGRNAS